MAKIFFSASTHAIPELFENYSTIVREIKKYDPVFLDWMKEWISLAREHRKKGKQAIKESEVLKNIDRNKLYEEHIRAIEKCDFIIAEVTRPTISVGYQLFHALLNKKPALALYYADADKQDFQKIKSIIHTDSPLITFKKYKLKTLPYIINRYLKKRSETLSKFNFVISADIKKYLSWLARKHLSQSKSDLLRGCLKRSLA